MVPASVRITAKLVPRLTCPAGAAEKFYWDSELTGFGLRAWPSGRRVWTVKYRDMSGKTKRVTLGKVEELGVDEARDAAKLELAKIRLGQNPAEERRKVRQSVTVAELATEYLTAERARLRPSSFDQKRRHLVFNSASIRNEKIASIGRAEIAKLVERLAASSGPVQANRARSSLSAMWTWAMKTGRVDSESNPAAYVPKLPERSRERVLTKDELKAIWDATGDSSEYSRIVRLLVVTGARRDEVGGLRLSEVQGRWWVIPAARMKNGKPHQVWLTDMALEGLPEPRGGQELAFGSGDGFSNWSRSKAALDARSGVENWVLHDLRRTMSSMLHDDGVIEPHVIEAMLAHTVPGIAGIYNRAKMLEARQAGWERWSETVKTIVGPPGNVIRLRRA